MAHDVWVREPEWLYLDESYWTISSLPKETIPSLEQKNICCTTSDNSNQLNPLYLLISGCLSWMKLLRIVVYVLRLVQLLHSIDKFVI